MRFAISNGMKIGFFDSGLGGLTILKAVAKELPDYDYIYYGDTANLPYGDKSEEKIFALTKAGVAFLFEQDCALVIIACNTASSETLRKLQDDFLPASYPDRRILGVIIPTIEEMINTKAKRALLLATRRTVESGKYPMELQKHNAKKLTLYSLPMPGLVPQIESGKSDEATKEAIKAIDDEERRVGKVDTVVLGCTHYTKLKDGLRRNYGNRIRFISQDELIPKKLADYLKKHTEIESKLTRGGTRVIKLTAEREDYDQIAAELLT